MPDDTKNLWDVCLSLAGTVGALVAAAFALYQWRMDQRWKRAEKFSKIVEDFEKDPLLKFACVALDWVDRTHRYDDRDVLITTRDVLLALRDHRTSPRGFDREQPLIRDAFDAFLSFLGHLESAITSGLIDGALAERYFRYWLERFVTMDMHPLTSGPVGDEVVAFNGRHTSAELAALYAKAYGDINAIRSLCSRFKLSLADAS